MYGVMKMKMEMEKSDAGSSLFGRWAADADEDLKLKNSESSRAVRD